MLGKGGKDAACHGGAQTWDLTSRGDGGGSLEREMSDARLTAIRVAEVADRGCPNHSATTRFPSFSASRLDGGA